MKKAISVIGNILITIIVIFSVLMTTIVIVSTKSEVGLPNLFGKAFFFVKTDSMMSDKGFDEGSLIIVNLVKGDDCSKLKVGDVVTFWRYYGGEKYLETHRIVEDKYTPYLNEVKDGILVHGGDRYYVTKGDNTPDIDFLSDLSGPDYANDGSIIGIWSGVEIPKLGAVMNFLQSQLGFMLCVVVPMAVFFLFELYKFISTLMENKKRKAVEAVSEAEDEIKQKAIAEYLAKQAAEKSSANESVEQSPAQETPTEEKTEPASATAAADSAETKE